MCHYSVDDTRFYLSFSSDPKQATGALDHCLEAVRDYMRVNKVELDPDKIETLLVAHSAA